MLTFGLFPFVTISFLNNLIIIKPKIKKEKKKIVSINNLIKETFQYQFLKVTRQRVEMKSCTYTLEKCGILKIEFVGKVSRIKQKKEVRGLAR